MTRISLAIALGAALSIVSAVGPVLAQALPPLLFSEMDGIHTLDDGTELPFWGYGYVAENEITLPAPVLIYTLDQNVNIVFTNPSPESHTIHLHGLDVDQANDGVPTTSMFIPMNGTGSYAFTADHEGTFLYHCHVTTTLHLSMGMYGMLIVKRPDGLLFEGGPAYSTDVPVLFSDLEIATNLDPTGSFPFHDLRPDYFMVNGFSGTQLEEPEQIIHYGSDGPVALRIGSMGYSRTLCYFPPELHAVCHMSDGRALSAPFAADTLTVFSGERFTVLISPDPGFDGTIEAQFWNAPDNGYEQSQFIRVRDEVLGLDEAAASTASLHPALTAYPNPIASGSGLRLHFNSPHTLAIFDASGRLCHNAPVPPSGLDISTWSAGHYTAHTSSPDKGTTAFIIQ
jgi:FtsP/CotA-like multicopper oxidase with cupredoxin domain